MRDLIELERLHLDENRLQTLDMTAFDALDLKRLTTVDLTGWKNERIDEIKLCAGNPWVCNCSLEWLSEWLSDNKKLNQRPRTPPLCTAQLTSGQEQQVVT